MHPAPNTATTAAVTSQSGAIEVGTGGTAQGWDAVRADPSIQYAPVSPPADPKPPGWLQDVFGALGELFAPLGKLLGASGPVLQYVLIAAAAAGLLYLLYQLAAPLLEKSAASPRGDDEWVPVEADVMALLDDADRLAAEGRFDEATHLLLQRSVGHIASARPDLIEPSSTAREIAALPALPDSARTAFSAISERVERSLFALHSLGRDDWQAARDAYTRFALASLPARVAGPPA